MNDLENDIIIIRGGGDLATGVVQKFYRSGMRVLILEKDTPLAVRRTVSLSETVYDGSATVEDMTAQLIKTPRQCEQIWKHGNIPILVDPEVNCIEEIRPTALIDAILAKKNLGIHNKMTNIVIGVGPGFSAPEDVHAVIETMRGHNLGRVVFQGTALKNTGIPADIFGQGIKRVMYSPRSGVVKHFKKIGDIVNEGDIVFSVNNEPVYAPFTGLLRGLIREGLTIYEGMKTADIDPRLDSDWNSISDKARCIGGATLEAYLYFRKKRG